ncbi:MAG: hypothetical protein HRF52_12190 [Ignavibacterium sp.]|jgi:hypothetical protein|uniref:hypothetical protein n=1 Tax=Ignavibacterium sp. TaxID=2651167 RepID=UPI0032996C29
MKRLVILIFLFNYTLIYPQLGINGGVDYTSFTAGSFKNTKLENNKYWLNGYFINFEYYSGMKLEKINSSSFAVAGVGLQYSNRKANLELSGESYQLTNGEISLLLEAYLASSSGIGFSIISELGLGWIGSDTPYDHSGVYGTMAIGVGPSILISRIRLYALGKLNLGYIYFSSSDPDPYSIEMSTSSSGLLSGPEINIGAGFIF